MMDRRTLLRVAAVVGPAGAVAACSVPTREAPVATPSPDPEDAPRVLLAYFSRAGENYYYGDRIDLEVGNTEVVAAMIAELAGLDDVDVFRIVESDPYPHDYEATVARNVAEQQQDARPAIADPLPDASAYDVVLLGSPIWNVQAPMIMRTFIDGVDLSGRTLHPFVTHAVSGMGRAATDYERLCPEALHGEGLAVQGETAVNARPEVETWLGRIGLLAT